MADPLIGVKDLVVTALTGFARLITLVPVGRIQAWDRDVDIRGEVETATDMGARIWIVPMPCELDLNYSSGSVRHVRNFAIGFGVGRLKLDLILAIERQIQCALARLSTLKQPDGTTPIEHPLPLTVESIGVRGSDPEREPLNDPEEWTDLYQVSVVAFEPRSALLG